MPSGLGAAGHVSVDSVREVKYNMHDGQVYRCRGLLVFQRM